MNLIEAMKSGKKFKRTGRTYYDSVEDIKRYHDLDKDDMDEILADDYELESSVPLTFKEAIESGKPFKRPNWNHYSVFLLKSEDLTATDYEVKND